MTRWLTSRRAAVPLPDFLVIGAPKAGTTALHSALALHPQLQLSEVKEPKFFLCGGPYGDGGSGPGDEHSRQEWIDDRAGYEQLFEGQGELLRGESTPFYLYDRSAHARIKELVPSAKLIAVVRDPIDRAYSNWLHLWADGLEPEPDFVTACLLEGVRKRRGWAPFWHYLSLGRYGEQLRDLFELYPRQQVHVLRYRELVDTPAAALDDICRFLGVETGYVSIVPSQNSRGYVPPSSRTRVLGSAIRHGAQLGALLPPRVWRTASSPLIWLLHRGSGPRPAVSPDDRHQLLEGFSEDVALLGTLSGEDYSDWLGDRGRGEFQVRRSAEVHGGDQEVGVTT